MTALLWPLKPSIISIDPGLHLCGVALWVARSERYELESAGLARRAAGPSSGPRAGLWAGMAEPVRAYLARAGMPIESIELVIEIPQVYARGSGKGDPNDLIDVAGVAGVVAGLGWSRIAWSPQPREWKGQLPKHVTEQRVRTHLAAHELDRIATTPKSLIHNVHDAVHLGLVYLERGKLR